jgi:hypothetical protein
MQRKRRQGSAFEVVVRGFSGRRSAELDNAAETGEP